MKRVFRNCKNKLLLIMVMIMVIIGVGMEVEQVSAKEKGYSGIPVTPQTITISNYKELGISEEKCMDYMGYYAIGTAEELYGFAEEVESGVVKGAVLTADIVVNPKVLDYAGDLISEEGLYTWRGIECIGESLVFDGQGYTISGLYYGNYANSRVGLFAWCDASVTIKNVGVVDSYFCGLDYVGGICGDTSYVNGVVNIVNCYFTGKISADGSYVGGICGEAGYYGSIRHCYNTGTVRGGDKDIGGICGTTHGRIENCYNTGKITGGEGIVGGIVGSVGSTGAVKECYNTGAVTINGSKAGGVCGVATKATITDCYNTAEIYANGSYVGGVCGSTSGTLIEWNHNTGSVTATGNYIGGIVGEAVMESSGKVNYNYNLGTVSGKEKVGGISGWALSVSYCYNKGTVSGEEEVGGIDGEDTTLANCYNMGEIDAPAHSSGPLVGRTTNYSSIRGCYYLSDVDNGMEKTEAQFRSGEVCYLLNGMTSEGNLKWFQTVGEDSYPVLEGKKIYVGYDHNATEISYSNDKNRVRHLDADINGSHDSCYAYIPDEDNIYAYVCSVCRKEISIFADVQDTDWFYPYVKYVYAYDLMKGNGVDAEGLITFDPHTSMTREMFVQVLYSREGKPGVEYTTRFTDVPIGAWYTESILWAAENKITSGVTAKRFGVGDKITREQMALMLYVYAQNKGYDVSMRTELSGFVDGHTISSWATEAIQWAVAAGIMSGKPSGDGVMVDPANTATRAECATMLKSFVKAYE